MSPALQPLRDAIARGRERFLALQPRERWIVAGGAVVLALVLIYLAVWVPMTEAHRRRAAALESARSIAARLEQAAVKVQNARAQSSGAVNRGMSLVAAVDQTTKDSTMGKPPTRVQPEGDKEVQVWFEDVGFDAAVLWLSDLQLHYGISVQTLNVEPQGGSGSVNIRVSLVRGA